MFQCYVTHDPELLDATFICYLVNFSSETGRFVGSRFFGFEAADSYSVTNLDRIETRKILSSCLIPPTFRAIHKSRAFSR